MRAQPDLFDWQPPPSVILAGVVSFWTSADGWWATRSDWLADGRSRQEMAGPFPDERGAEAAYGPETPERVRKRALKRAIAQEAAHA